MKKRMLGVILSLILAVPVVSGCSSDTEEAAAKEETVSEEETEESTEDAESIEEEETQEEEEEASDEGTEEESSEDDLLAQILESGTLVAAMEGDWSPWSYHDTETNEVVGFDADVAREIGARLGVEVEIVEAPWESLFAGLDTGRYDIVVNGVEITDERAEKYDFSDPYGYIRTALVVRGDNEEITSFEDLEGKETVNSLGSTYMELAESYGASATGVSTLGDTIQNVIDGRADATLNADVSIYDYMNEQPDANIKIVALTDEASQVAIPVPKGDNAASLLAAINEALADMREDGTLSQISETYFGSDITQE